MRERDDHRRRGPSVGLLIVVACIGAVLVGGWLLLQAVETERGYAALRGREEALRNSRPALREIREANNELMRLDGYAFTLTGPARLYGVDLIRHWNTTVECAGKARWSASVNGRGGPCPEWRAATDALKEGRREEAALLTQVLGCSSSDLEYFAVLTATPWEEPTDAADIAAITRSFEACRSELSYEMTAEAPTGPIPDDATVGVWRMADGYMQLESVWAWMVELRRNTPRPLQDRFEQCVFDAIRTAPAAARARDVAMSACAQVLR